MNSELFARFCRPSPLKAAAIGLIVGSIALPAFGQELIHQEGFNDDGEKATPPRYTTTGRDAFEVPRIISELNNLDQKGPIYWAHNFEVSFVGIPEIPARRMIFTWNGANDTSTASQDFLNLFVSSVKWMVKDKANATIVVTPNAAGIGGLADGLIAAGYTLNDDDLSLPDEQLVADLYIHANTSNPSRFALINKPVIVMNAPDLDDMIVASIGATMTFEPGTGEITTPGHPAAGGKTGTFQVATGELSFHLLGRFLPQGATTLATVVRTIPPSVTRLGDVDEMIAGTKQATKSTGQVAALDFSDNSAGNWFVDNALPGGETGNWGLHGRGKLNVTAAGTYSIAIGSDDGARLQIDLDRNGFGSSDTIIEDLGPHGHLIQYGDVTFSSTGVFDFQVIAYNSGGPGSVEFSVAKAAGAGTRSALDSGEWDLVGADDATSPVKAQGMIDVNGFVASGASTDVKEPLIVLLNGPDDTPRGFFYGGGAFEGFEGTGFFGASGLNKWPFPEGQSYRSLRLKAVDVTGKKDVRLKVALAGSQIDTETSDFLDILAYPNGPDSTPVVLAHFQGVQNAVQPWMADQKENFVRRLTRTFADFEYDIPAGATQLLIEFRGFTSWWNELAAFDNVRITAGAAPPDLIPALTSVGAPPTRAGTGLDGRYWQRKPKSITTLLGTTGAVETVVKKVQPTARFIAKKIDYTGNDLTKVETWLGTNAASLNPASPGNLDDGLLSFTGWIAIKTPGQVRFSTPSDDGSVVTIGGVQVINNDGSHGSPGDTPNGTATFEAAGLYPIEIHYFNGDWLNDAGTDHGGANIQFTSNGAGGIGSANAVVPTAVLYSGTDLGIVPTFTSAGTPPTKAGTGLDGRYWQRAPKSITTLLGPTGAVETVVKKVPPTATFTATKIDYTGNDLTKVETWLGTNAASLNPASPGNLDDGLFSFNGWIAIKTPGQVRFSTPSDDGSVVTIGGVQVINNDGSHGSPGDFPNGTVTFQAAGLYPIAIQYFNGDWLNDAGTDHGGANIQFTSNGAGGIGSANAVVPTAVLYSGTDLGIVPAYTSAGPLPVQAGTGLAGRYWQRAPKSITTLLGPTGAVETVIKQVPPTATFLATAINYTGNDLTKVETWLGTNATSLNPASPGNLDDGLFSFTGWIAIKEPGQVRFSTPSDDGSVVRIGGIQVINNDGSHGSPGDFPNGAATFQAAGLYPIEIHYFNGDWLNDAGTDHGGANIQFTSNGAGGIGAANQVVPKVVLYPTLGGAPAFESIKIAAGTITITWSGAATLQSADEVTGPYVQVQAAASPYNVQAAAAPRRFYRLRQ